jgi:hypothetical protein
MVKLLSTLDEAQKRWFVGREAMLLGHGGLKRMCELSGLSKPTVNKGIRELKAKQTLREEGRVRQVGGGRKPLQQQDPEAFKLLQQLMEENTAGDPMSLLRWSSKSTYQIRDQLVAQGHPISEDTVARWRESPRPLAAGQRQGARGQFAAAARPPVPLHQCVGQAIQGAPRTDYFGRCEKEGTHRSL